MMAELKWLGVGCLALALIIAGGIGLHTWFGDKAGLVILLGMLFIGGSAILGDALRYFVGR